MDGGSRFSHTFTAALANLRKRDNRVLVLAVGGGVALFLMVGLVVAGGILFARKSRSEPDKVVASKPATGPSLVQPTIQVVKYQDPGRSPADPTRPADPARPAGNATAIKRDWHKRTLIDAYDRIGKKNAKWDADVHELLRFTAEDMAVKRTHSVSALAPFGAAFKKAESAGCDDPLVLYAGGRIYNDSFHHNVAAQKMEASAYHPVHRAYAHARAALWYTNRPPGLDTTQQINRHLDAAVKLLPEIMRDKDVPVAVTNALLEKMQEQYHATYQDRKSAFDKINAELEKAAPNSTVLYTFQGRFYVSYAWDARGGGWANTVTEDGWRVFGQRLTQAETALEKAWQLDNSNTDAATTMITVELGQGKGRQRMETWHSRAMTADPDNYTACSNKVYYLEPKWHGSPAEMLAFGRECLKGANWQGKLPFILVEAHENLSQYNRDNRNAYYLQAEVWPDMKSVFEPYLQQKPTDDYERSRYALFACRCGHWDEANRQFNQLGNNADPRIFGGAQNLIQLRNEAAAKGKPVAQAR
jgi:hypothetical protein